ncbi:hypothetical protein ASF65_20470 [Aureimonas sp. Leaf324]|nr:hypothetical protein ASF65_20470 [Aureimonas sp. Leaf324]
MRSVLHPKPSRHEVGRSEGSPQAIPDAPRAVSIVPSSIRPIAGRSLRAIAARSTFSGAEVAA